MHVLYYYDLKKNVFISSFAITETSLTTIQSTHSDTYLTISNPSSKYNKKLIFIDLLIPSSKIRNKITNNCFLQIQMYEYKNVVKLNCLKTKK